MSDLLSQAYGATTGVVEALAGDDFDRPTWTAAWSVRELLFHQLLDAQRSLVALASPTEAATDVDDVTYWAPFRPAEGDGGAAHARFVQVAASAYATSASLVGHWRSTADALVRAATAADPESHVETQGHVLTVADLASTLVVEATVHLLDLTRHVPGAPTSACLAHTRDVLVRLAGAPLPGRWDDATAALKATGRVPLEEADRVELGALAERVPLLG